MSLGMKINVAIIAWKHKDNKEVCVMNTARYVIALLGKIIFQNI